MFRAFGKSGDLYSSKVVILATGTKPVELKRIFPTSVDFTLFHRDITTLPLQLEGKVVLIVGGGDSALDSALSVIRRGGVPKLLIRGGDLKASPYLVGQVREYNIELFYHDRILETIALGDGKIVVSTDKKRMIKVDYLMACVGRVPSIPKLENFKIGENGFFLAGDVVGRSMRFAAIALSDGVIAAEKGMEFLYQKWSRERLG